MMGKNKSGADTLLRQWHMLRAIPRHPRKVGVTEIRKTLATAGFDVTARTIQRDLIELSAIFPLDSDERERPYGWSWQAHALAFDLPNLSNQEALAFVMMEDYLRPLLPQAMLDQLRPYFVMARKRLASVPTSRGSASWLGKVAVVQPTQALIPPQVDPEVHAVVTNALLHDRRVFIKYRKKGEHKAQGYVLNPRALVQRGPISYIVGSVASYHDVRMFALHRIQSAVPRKEPAVHHKGFALDDYLATGALDFGAGGRIRLDAVFDASAAEHLYEAPLTEDQKLTALDNDLVRLQATVTDTPQLRWWLLAFGDGVEIRAPAKLRREFSSIAASLVAHYNPKR